MKKSNLFLSMSLMLGMFFVSLEAEDKLNDKTNTKKVTVQEDKALTDEKFNIMERDENEDSDTLAIPFDDSEVEDEEEIDRIEDKNEFNLPKGR